jgi:hypothetical protein
MARHDSDSFDLELEHADYAVHIYRRASQTVMFLPRHGVAYAGTGKVTGDDHLVPEDILARLISSRSKVATYLPLLQQASAETFAAILQPLLDQSNGNASLQFPQAGSMELKVDDVRVELHVAESAGEPSMLDESVRTVEIPRTEIEQTLLRGVRRATEILAPARVLTNPPEVSKTVPHGELRWIDGHRVALLTGSPAQIGTAHGQLLKEESTRCIESVLYTFGTVHVIRTGHWFRHDLKDAYARLAPHIPERHKQETRSLAAALDLDAETLEILNVFPEMFHCSGFAVFGSATADGRLYHGRVLDYMTTIGLQDAATTFIVAPDGHHSFANVGYASFIGSVTGMNNQAISLGEMGGRGEGNWDGAPMATLMRRALEECSTLDEVKQLWTISPRTCEYYYVFADGKTNQAVGVAALPESIEFINPGQAHERLGTGITDAVVLSAGSRLTTLRSRVQEKHGQIDAEVARWLMSRPVAMQSNLHNVLFIPQDGILYVANASHTGPAAEQHYVELNLNELLKSVSGE